MHLLVDDRLHDAEFGLRESVDPLIELHGNAVDSDAIVTFSRGVKLPI